MQSGLYVALSSQVALEKRLTTIADNIANSNTVGFRGTDVKFEELLGGVRRASTSFVSDGEALLSQLPGGLDQTGNALDFAIKGDAWFAIETEAGQVLTRDGRFEVTLEGALVTTQGYPVLDPGGAVIQLNPAGGQIGVGRDGAVMQNGAQTAAIGLFAYEAASEFQRFGNSGILTGALPEPLVDQTDVQVMQGFVEQSNVNPVQELSNLIMVQRNFDNVSALMRDSESALSDAIRTLGSRS
jgi:flagellar basal-body rod protein FlgF